jgi:hypothetical protein
MKTKQEIEDDFEWWITCIPDKIIRLEKLVSKDLFDKLDFSIESLEILGEYIVQTVSISGLQKNKELWDCYASYIGTSYRRNVPTAQWFIELNDDKNIYYGVPSLITDAKTIFVPHYEITTMLDRKRIDFLIAITKKHIEILSNASD